MKDKAASTLMKIKKKANEEGKSNQQLLQLFCQEELLRRLGMSKYKENFILKGGLFVYTLTNFESRSTVDVDFLLKDFSNQIQKVQQAMKEVFQEKTENDFVTFEIQKTDIINIQKEYTGVCLNILANIKNTRTKISIDIGVGDVIVPHSELRQLPVVLPENEPPVIYTYSIETTIAEKLDAMFDRKEFTSRMKDYYDLYYLSYRFSFKSSILCEAICKTFENRGKEYSIDDFEYICHLADHSIMLTRWNSFVKKLQQPELSFDIVLKRIYLFLYEPLMWTFQKKSYNKIWNSDKEKWE